MVRSYSICFLCEIPVSCDTVSSHFLNNHIDEITTPNNLKKVLNYSEKGLTCWPISFEIDKKEIHFVPCCRKFFMFKTYAKKHLNDSKDCREKVRKCAKEFYDEYKPYEPPSTTNNITNNQTNNIVNNNLFLDFSGNRVPLSPEALKAILKELITTINIERRDKATLYKNTIRLKTKCGDDYSECSEAESYYSDIDEPVSDEEKVVRRFSFSKEAKGVMKKFNIPKELVTSRSLGLSGKKEHLERKQIKDEEKQFDNELIEEEKSEKRASIMGDIKAKEEKIAKHKKDMKHFSGLIDQEESGVTQKVYEEEYDKTKEIKKLEEEICQLRRELTSV